jgi:hypothetical protein
MAAPMATAPDHFDRDRKDDAEARRWVKKVKKLGEQGKLTDDSAFVAEKLAEVKRKLASQ